MISTLLIEVPWLPVSVLTVVVLLGPLAAMLLDGHRRAARVLLGVDVIAVLVVTLAPEWDSPLPGIGCAAGLPYLAPTAVESVANVLLSVPTALLAGVVLRRPGLAIVVAIGLSAAVEATQAVLPGIGRACDTSDLITNSIGALLGGLGAFIGALLTQRRAPRPVLDAARRRS